MLKKLVMIYLASTFASAVWAAPAENRSFQASGEVLNVSPVHSRITIKHGLISGFSESAETEFATASKDLLEKISGGDLVSFTITETRGNAQITQIERTGVAEKQEQHLGQAIQKTLEGAGEAVTQVAGIVPPAGEVVGSASGAATGATGTILNNADPQVKQDF